MQHINKRIESLDILRGYTWIWSSLTFGVTVMLGAFAGQVIKAGSAYRRHTALRLAQTPLWHICLARLSASEA